MSIRITCHISFTTRRKNYVALIRDLLDSGWSEDCGGGAISYDVPHPRYGTECHTAPLGTLDEVLRLAEQLEAEHRFCGIDMSWPGGNTTIGVEFNVRGFVDDHLHVVIRLSRLYVTHIPGHRADRKWYEERIIPVLVSNGCEIANIEWEEDS